MAIHALHIDLERCIACFACEVSCEQENGLPFGVSWIRISKTEKVFPNGKVVSQLVPKVCHHCDEPLCATKCPEKAILKNPQGIVLIDVEACSGCGLCMEDCPFGAIQINHDMCVAQKCTMCAHRIEKGLSTTCAMHCPAGAITFVSFAQPNSGSRNQ